MPKLCATVILVDQAGRILMQLRDDGNGKTIPFPNMWNFPGGGAEGDESAMEAAVREIREEFEIDLDPADLQPIFSYSHRHAATDAVFACQLADDVDPVLHEGAAMAWKSLDEVASLPLGFEQWRALPAIACFMTAHGHITGGYVTGTAPRDAVASSNSRRTAAPLLLFEAAMPAKYQF